MVSKSPAKTGTVIQAAVIDGATSALIKQAALRTFVEHGYHGTSVREIADAVGMSVAGLYHHFPSKLDILFELMSSTMDDLIQATEGALAEAGSDPVEQLRAIVTAHVRFHTDRREESFVGNTELRSLDSAKRRAIVEKRDHQQRLFDRVIVAGEEGGVFATPFPLEASRAVVTMSTAVANWFRKDGPLSPDEIAERYSQLALATVGYVDAGAAPGPGGGAPAA